MQYWAAGRALGCSEAEFWRSTLAQLTALSKAKTADPDSDECNDCTPSQAPDWLKQGWDADRGAMGDWREMRGQLKGVTRKHAERQQKLRAYGG